MIARVVSDSKERMPLHAWATSKGIAGRLITFPSRNTGTPQTGRMVADSFEARICNGKVIWLKTIAGIGTIKIMKSRGKSTPRNIPHPQKKTIIPAISIISDTRERKSSAPKTPRISTDMENEMIGSPQVDGVRRIVARRKRSCQRGRNENAGAKKAWDKLGTADPWCAHWISMEAT